MHMNIKKTAAVFAVAAALAAFSAVSYAEGNVAEVDGVGYDTLQEAVNAAESGDTVKLIADLTGDKTLTSAVTIDYDDNITLDLDGHTIENDPVNEERTFNVYGTMTVTGNGKITSESMGVFDTKENGNLTIESGTYESAGYRTGKLKGSTVRTRKGSKTTIEDGVKISCEKVSAVYSDGDITLNECELISKSHSGLKGDDGFDLWAYCTQIVAKGELNGTTVRGVQGGLYVGGEATINGGSYTAAELTDGSYKGNKAFYGLYISNGAEVTINGGAFTGGGASGGYCVLNSDNDTGMELGSPIIINDGIFNGKVGSLNSDKVRDAYGITAYGGTFAYDPMYFAASTYVSMQEDGKDTYTIVKSDSKATLPGTYKTAAEGGYYDQMALFEVSQVPEDVTYNVSAGTYNKNFTYKYATTEGITKLGLIVTDIPSTQTVTVELGGQNNG